MFASPSDEVDDRASTASNGGEKGGRSAMKDPAHPIDHHGLHTHFESQTSDAVGAEAAAPSAAPPSSRRHQLSHFHLPHFHPNLFKHHHHQTPLGTPTTDATHSHRTSGEQDDVTPTLPKKDPPCCPVKMIIFTVNLLVGLTVSQLVPEFLDGPSLGVWSTTVKCCTMFCLSYIMIHVGYEFDIDKSRLRSYAKDYAVGMTAAGLPWITVALWFIFVLPNPLGWKEALVAARFAAPTSAGILFAMLEAAGLKETWLFSKARILAIFDDLDTILLMVPLKVIVVGLRWELSIDLALVVVCFTLIWRLLHRVNWPSSWRATMGYAACITFCSEMTHFLSHDPSIDPLDVVETIHLEILLPAFTIGCIVRAAHTSQIPDTRFVSGPSRLLERSKTFMGRLQRRPSMVRERKQRIGEAFVNDLLSCLFMLLVGLSMPSLFQSGDGASAAHRMLASGGDGSGGAGTNVTQASGSAAPTDSMEAGQLVLHVIAVSLLMIVGKMFPLCVYRDEANLKTRLALSLGMCPRGEVGAGVIVISLTFGIGGDAITIAVICLAINLVMSSFFIMAVKTLARTGSGNGNASGDTVADGGNVAGGQQGGSDEFSPVKV